MEYEIELDWDDFLKNFWQKRPVLLKNAMKDFIDPISADELAGLAMEEEVESRIIMSKLSQWEVLHGPFNSFEQLTEKNWSLLVQAVNHWHIPSAKLLSPFQQLPHWRFDDLMISFSVPGGGVGPHVDQYDVFIIQGQGKRHWRVGEKRPVKEHIPHPDLLHVEPFTAIIDEEITAGDILYIPPGFPHEGYTIESALNYSVGFRAPNIKELMSNLADYLIDEDLGKQHYADPDLMLGSQPSVIQSYELDKLRALMCNFINSPEPFNTWFGKFISYSHHELDLAPVEPPYSSKDIKDLLKQGEKIQRIGGLRVLMIGESCFINGEFITLNSAEPLHLLAEHPILDVTLLGAYVDNKDFLLLLCDLINEGYWYFID